MSNKASLGAGNVDIELNGETVTLRPTLKAARAVSRQAGGIAKAIEAIGNFDLDAMTGVVALGLDREPGEVADAIWRTGMAKLAGPVIEYLSILANGGRPVDASGGEGNDRPPKGE